MPTVIVLVRIGKNDVKIHGNEIASVAGGLADQPAGEVWTQLTLLEDNDGNWIAVRQRTIPNFDGMVGEYEVIKRQPIDTSPTGSMYGFPSSEEEGRQQMIRATMKSLEWSFLAKELAASQGWVVVEWIGSE